MEDGRNEAVVRKPKKMDAQRVEFFHIFFFFLPWRKYSIDTWEQSFVSSPTNRFRAIPNTPQILPWLPTCQPLANTVEQKKKKKL